MTNIIISQLLFFRNLHIKISLENDFHKDQKLFGSLVNSRSTCTFKVLFSTYVFKDVVSYFELFGRKKAEKQTYPYFTGKLPEKVSFIIYF